MFYITNLYFYSIIFLLYKTSICFIALPFNTIFIRNTSISPKNDYRAQMLQNEINVNISLGNPGQNITFILKMDLYGLSIYNTSFYTNLSNTYEFINDERRLGCILQINTFTSRDYFHIPTFNSFTEFNNYICQSNLKNSNNIIKSEKIEFLLLKKVQGSITKFNDLYGKMGIIGLKLNFDRFLHPPEFVTIFKEIGDIKTHTFYLKFDDNNINGFFNSNNTGYFIVGEELTDDENEKKNIKYTKAKERLDIVNWDLAFDDIISKSKENESIVYRPEYKHAELYVNFPYIFAPRFYEPFIKKAFFQELLIKKVCDYTYTINGDEFVGYKCDGKSELFLENLNNKFPDLIFEHKELDEKFVFKGKDLFTYNIYNESDTFLYFNILFPQPQLRDRGHPMSWILGIPFLKKYPFSFNYDNKLIGYLKKNNGLSHNSFSFYKKEIIIILFIFSIILSFILGIYTNKNINKIPRKSKANELNDNYEYIDNKSLNNNKCVNSKNKESKKEIELSSKLIN